MIASAAMMPAAVISATTVSQFSSTTSLVADEHSTSRISAFRPR
jgi:hypothetical protein